MTKNTAECKHEFTFILDSRTAHSETVEDALFEADCDDSILSFQDGIMSMVFCRSAASLEDAVASAIHDVKKANIGNFYISKARIRP